MSAPDVSALPPRSGTRIAAIALASLGVIVLAHALTTDGGAARAAVADLGWTWASGFAAFTALLVRRRLTDAAERRGLAWMAAGCGIWCAGQIAWDAGDLLIAGAAGSHLVADVGYVAIYPCLILAAVALIRTQPRRDIGLEGTLDALIVTFTTAAVTYELLVRDALLRPNRASAVDMSILCGLGAIALLWTIVIGALYRTRLPRAAGTLALGGLLVFAASNVAYAGIVLSGRLVPGQVIDLGWNAAFLTIAAATGLTPRRPGAVLLGAGNSTLAPRLLAMVVGVGGMLWLATSAILTPQPEPRIALLVSVGGLLLALRLAYALFADQRYATLLEHEVERQTRSLIDSLDATAAAERSLRLVMDAVPDSIITLDREGRPLDLNPAAWEFAAVAAGPRPGRSIFEGLEGDAARITRENLDGAFRGEVRRFELPVRRADGAPGVHAVLYAPVREGGEIRRVIALSRDISEQRRTELQLQQSERLAAMGQLVGGVAHEINNPAAIISGFAQTLLRDPLPDRR
ncbi:MAG TPA: PAS domain-containing protein, partial [Gemmatimonadales bacterium]